MTTKPTDDRASGKRKPQLLHHVIPGDPLDDVNVVYDNEFPEDLKEAVKAVLSENPELWFIEARTKDGKTALIHRGPHP